MNKPFLCATQWIAILGAMLCSCANPTKAIQSDIERFKSQYPDHISSYTSDGRTMQFAWSGDPKKRPLIFVHGSPGSWEGWAHFLLEPALQNEFQVIAVDRPGYGGSEAGRTEPSLEKQASAILGVLKFNQSHEGAILVGHSFGGPVIARMAMDHPEQIAGLIFVASSVDPSLEETKWIQYPGRWWPISALIPTELRVCNEEIFELKKELIAMLPHWDSIRAKTTILQGTSDELVPPANFEFLKKHIRPSLIADQQLVPGLNHFIPWKRPDLILLEINILSQTLRSPNP